MQDIISPIKAYKDNFQVTPEQFSKFGSSLNLRIWLSTA